MENFNGKRLLVLGGTFASLRVVDTAREMGVHTIVTDPNEGGVAKEIADETASVDTADIDGLVALCRERKVDGIFCGPSEFNLRNVITVSEKAGLPCYTTMEVWNRCAEKDTFKRYCREYGVDCPPEYAIDLNTPAEELEKIDYPIIVKPVDGSSSAGISVCRCADEVRPALEKAYAASKSRRIIAEKYIDNGGKIFTGYYVLRDGEAYLYGLGETYVADPVERKSLFSVYGRESDQYTDYYMKNMHPKVSAMFRGMGMRNGAAFFQALPYNGRIYFHEMGYRLSGGSVQKQPSTAVLSLDIVRIMVRLALGGSGVTDEEIQQIRLTKPVIKGTLKILLGTGTIGRIEGIEEAQRYPTVLSVLPKHAVGDTIDEKLIGTMGQHLCMISFQTATHEEEEQTIRDLQDMIRAYDTEGNLMNTLPFDVKRLTM